MPSSGRWRGANRSSGARRPAGKDTLGQDGLAALFGLAAAVAGGVECWGQNLYDAATAPSGEFKAIASGSTHTCGISVHGDLYCWGSNDRGQLGTGTLTDEPIPIQVVIRD